MKNQRVTKLNLNSHSSLQQIKILNQTTIVTIVYVNNGVDLSIPVSVGLLPLGGLLSNKVGGDLLVS